MAHVLIISSEVARGTVGGGVTRFVLQRLGHDVVMLPTVLLSNAPDQAHVAGDVISADLLHKMVDVYATNERLQFDAVFVGYLPSSDHVKFAVETVSRLQARNEEIVVCVDPIMGDEPGGLYIKEPTARAIRNDLVRLADVITPNRFELGWLNGCDVASLPEVVIEAKALLPHTVLVTSATKSDTAIGTFLRHEAQERYLKSPHIANAPKGPGDFMAALFFGYLLSGAPHEVSFMRTVKAMGDVMAVYDADTVGKDMVSGDKVSGDKAEPGTQRNDGLPLVATQSIWAE